MESPGLRLGHNRLCGKAGWPSLRACGAFASLGWRSRRVVLPLGGGAGRGGDRGRVWDRWAQRTLALLSAAERDESRNGGLSATWETRPSLSSPRAGWQRAIRRPRRSLGEGMGGGAFRRRVVERVSRRELSSGWFGLARGSGGPRVESH